MSARADLDVAVVGAGFSGLAAARRIAAAGLKVVVFEANDRVGGRVDREDLGDGLVLDLGGTWTGPTQDRIASLAAEVGVEVFPQFADGRNQIEFNGRVRSYGGTIPRLGVGALLDLARLQFGAGRAAKRVAAGSPWDARKADLLDSITLEDWMCQRHHGQTAQQLLGIAGKTIWGAEPREMSLLYVLHYIASAGGLDALLDTEGGAQHERFTGGALSVAERVAAELGDRVVLNAPVEAISTEADAVVLQLADQTVRADQVIVALPPPLCERISFAPALPEARAELQRSWRMGALTKVFAVYKRPFWRDAGFTGEALSDASPASLTFDVSPEDRSQGVLVGFVGGDDARSYAKLEASARRALVLEGFARLYGDEALEPERWLERDWAAQPWSRGGPVAIAPPGALTSGREALRAPIGRLHWAGTETAERSAGYIDGAVRSGERAADEILAGLSARRSA
ncbi:MAG: FAD-dependent oxidoreductase [Actinomycetes bacterium]